MKTIFNTHYIARTLCTAIIPFAFFACGDNPIEINDTYMEEAKIPHQKSASADFKDALKDVDYYKCKQTYNAARCNTFYEIFGSYDCEEIADPTYNDKGEKLVPLTSSSSEAPAVSSSSEDTVLVDYLQKNKTLNITITHYKQKVAAINENDTLGDPEIKFTIKNYSDSEYVNTLSTHILLDEKDTKEWNGTKSAAIFIPRGMNKIQVCPIISDKNGDEEDDEILSTGECLIIEALGQIEDRKTVFEKDTTSKKYELEWEWFLY